ncbi:DUF3048 domain-containing protein [Ruania suaedae]|uniref:DUF3048 domain-containing protein n=1 Tax=Ruania suaedae TaxID=2897774 RepID=UPI001E34E19D|nr:DUF3048 domain-containing protein [Ruania suaedae]UFU02494.1 DUF3048 domain-containing protein [Ruania suaedae]
MPHLSLLTRAGRGRIGSSAAATAALMLTLAACTSPGEPAGTPSPTTTPETTAPADADKQHPPEPEVAPTWPLTGEPLGEDAADRPALAIKIENSEAARPQTGLQAADVVWEEMVEGGITRFNAVYHSDLPVQVGPVRSVRPMDAAMSAPYGGLLVASGGQAPFIGAAREAGLQVLTHDLGHGGFTRSSARFAPHNLYGTPSLFVDQADGAHSDPPPEQLAFAHRGEDATAVTDGSPAEALTISFPRATPSWDWDGQAWLRSEDGAPATTEDTGRISAVNVVALRVEVTTTSYVDPSGANVPETIMTGGGEAVVATGGQVLEGTWSKESATDPVVLTTGEGEEILLAPGNTWIELVPTSGAGVSVS